MKAYQLVLSVLLLTGYSFPQQALAWKGMLEITEPKDTTLYYIKIGPNAGQEAANIRKPAQKPDGKSPSDETADAEMAQKAGARTSPAIGPQRSAVFAYPQAAPFATWPAWIHAWPALSPQFDSIGHCCPCRE